MKDTAEAVAATLASTTTKAVLAVAYDLLTVHFQSCGDLQRVR